MTTPDTFDEERVSAVIQGTQSSPTHAFPGAAGEGMLVSLRALSEPELEVCRVQARLELRRLAAVNSWSEADVAALDPRFHQRLIRRVIVAAAFLDADADTTGGTRTPLFSSPEEVAGLSDVVVSRLFALYVAHQEWANPRTSLSPDEGKALGDELRSRAKDAGGIERARARNSTVLVDYYGTRSARELTDWQVLYWLHAQHVEAPPVAKRRAPAGRGRQRRR